MLQQMAVDTIIRRREAAYSCRRNTNLARRDTTQKKWTTLSSRPLAQPGNLTKSAHERGRGLIAGQNGADVARFLAPIFDEAQARALCSDAAARSLRPLEGIKARARRGGATAEAGELSHALCTKPQTVRRWRQAGDDGPNQPSTHVQIARHGNSYTTSAAGTGGFLLPPRKPTVRRPLSATSSTQKSLDELERRSLRGSFRSAL